MKLLLCLIFFSSVVSACPAEGKLPVDALQMLYRNQEVMEYVCVGNPTCDESEFLANLDVKEINLSSSPDKKISAVLVEPTKKGRQYFSAVFVKNACESQMVFSPDTSLSGLKIMTASKNRFYILRGTERDSTESWKETDYGYDSKLKQYTEIKTRCFREKNGKSVAIKCDA
ncbi:MAG: hypothetical protein V4631_20430 [Pseudomonadota bacterium]